MPNYNKTFAARLRICSGTALLCLALVLPLFLSGTIVHAQRGGRRHSIDDRVKVFAKNLDLTEPQQAAVKKILEQRQQEMLRLRADSSISGSERIERFRSLQDQTVLRIRSVLNDEQKKKYDPLAVRKVTPAPDQKSVEDWIKATPKN